MTVLLIYIAYIIGGRDLKKLISILLALSLILSTITMVCADGNGQNMKKTQYVYKYNGINITSNVKLSKDELKELMSDTMKRIKNNSGNNNGEVNPTFVPSDPEGNSILVAGPSYRVYDNSDVQIVAGATVGWIVSKIPAPIQSTYLGYVAVAWMTAKVDGINDTYVGAWVSKSYSTYDEMYKYYSTLVHFSNSTYSTPIDVQYNVATNYYPY